MNTYVGWITEGRYVRAGEKAASYFYNSDRTARKAAFAIEQTETLEDASVEGWDVIPIEECPDLPPKQKQGRKALIWYDSSTKFVAIWVGSNQKAIKGLRKHGFTFRQQDRRWVATRDDIDTVIESMWFYAPRLDVTVDGQPYEPQEPPAV